MGLSPSWLCQGQWTLLVSVIRALTIMSGGVVLCTCLREVRSEMRFTLCILYSKYVPYLNPSPSPEQEQALSYLHENNILHRVRISTNLKGVERSNVSLTGH
jgi:hypothetical protein